MARFEVTINGQRYEVNAADEQSALNALQGQFPDAFGPPSAQSRYDTALEGIRQSQFSDFTPEQWSDYSSKMLSPYDFQGVAQNAQTFGFGDEINSAIGALGSQVRNWLGDESSPGFGEAYSQYSELEQARRDLGRQQLGAGALAADVIGGFSGLGPARGAGFASQPISINAMTPQALANNVIAGSTLGFLGGYGAADEDRLDAAAQGAGIGTVLGRFGPTIANAVSSGYGNVARALAFNKAAGQAGMEPGVARFIGEALNADDALSASGLSRINAAGPEGMIADAGPSARRMLDTSIQSSGTAGQVARTAINERLTRDAQAIQNALNNNLGLPEGITTARARIASETAGDRSDAYRAAYGAPIDYASDAGREIEALMKRVPQSAINAANNLMKVEGSSSPQILASIADDGTVTYLRMPSVEQLDYITRGLNAVAQGTEGQGAFGNMTDIGRAYQNLSSQIRKTVKGAVPEYEEALNTASDAIGRSQAVKLGADLLNPSFTMDDAIRATQDLSQPQKEALAQGLRSQIDNMISRVTRTLGNPDTETREAAKALVRLSDRATRTKIEAALGEDVARNLFDELDRAGMSFELAASVADNSATFSRQNQKERLATLAGGNGPVATLAQGEPLNAGKRVIQALTGMTPDAIMGRQDDFNRQIAQFLTARGPEAIRNWQIMAQLGQTTGNVDAVAQALLAGINRASLPSSFASQRYLAGSQ